MVSFTFDTIKGITDHIFIYDGQNKVAVSLTGHHADSCMVIVEKSLAERIVDDVLNATSTGSDIEEVNVIGSEETGDDAL